MERSLLAIYFGLRIAIISNISYRKKTLERKKDEGTELKAR